MVSFFKRSPSSLRWCPARAFLRLIGPREPSELFNLRLILLVGTLPLLWMGIPAQQIAVRGQASPVKVISIDPPQINPSAWTILDLQGEHLDEAQEFALLRPSRLPFPTTIDFLTSTTARLVLDMRYAPIGGYQLSYRLPALSTWLPAGHVELTRPPQASVSGPVIASETFPFYSLANYSNTEILLTSDMIASAGGLLSGFRLFPVEGSQGFTGQLIFRVKMTSATQFESDQLDPSGWSPLYDGAFSWEPGQPFELPGNTAFDYDGKSSLILSLVFAMPAGNYLLGGFEAIDTPAPRFRAGSNTGVNPPPEDWQGNFPPNRSLKSTIPRLELIFIHSPVLAGFQATPLEIPIGGTVQFTDKSLGAVANRWWDFNFDGIVDSLEKNPAHRYSKPGLYTVELRVRNGTTEDAETAWQLIRVLPSSD